MELSNERALKKLEDAGACNSACASAGTAYDCSNKTEVVSVGLSDEQRRAQARELCIREYGLDPEAWDYDFDDVDLELIAKVRKAIEFADEGHPSRDVLDDDEKDDALRLLLNVLSAHGWSAA
jgi:hypothetical protein